MPLPTPLPPPFDRGVEAVDRGGELSADERAVLAAQFAALVGHDLRSPLAAIKMSALLLGRADLAPVQARALERLNSSAARTQALLGDVVDFIHARLGTGMPLLPQPVDLHDCVARGIAAAAPRDGAPRVEHQRRGDGACVADPERVEQVVAKLLDNALRHADAAHAVVVTSCVDAAGGTVTVCNRGAPISAALQSRLFAPLLRSRDPDEAGELGAGGAGGNSVALGLYLVREIARAHGGDATLRSDDAGTCVEVTFPRLSARVGDGRLAEPTPAVEV